MRRPAVLLVAGSIAVAGCGGGSESKTDKVSKQVEQSSKRLHERVKRAGKKADPADKALLEIEKSDMPADVKQQLLEAKELLDKYKPK